MVRVEFLKGKGGVINIINGNLRDTDRNALLNIEDIDRVIVNIYNALAINYNLKALEVAGYVIVFETLEAMEPYLNQMDLLDGEIFNPGINGIKKPSWDISDVKLENGIIPHTYVNTDIEKDLIKGK